MQPLNVRYSLLTKGNTPWNAADLFAIVFELRLWKCVADFAKALSTKKMDEAGNRGRELLQSTAAGGSCFNTNVVQTAVSQCENATTEGDCSWRRNFRVSSAFLTVSFDTTQSACCCACKSVPDCLGVHYISVKNKCVFHYGGEPESNPDPGTSAWIKQ